MPQKSLTEHLTDYKNRKRERLYELGLHIRVRELASIQDKRERTREKLRHARVRYDLEGLNDGVRRLLRGVTNGDRLLDIYNVVDLKLEDRTHANILEQRLKNIDSIIELIEKDPNKYATDNLALTNDVQYSSSTGIIQQGLSSFPVKGDAKKLLDYLWGKRKILYRDRSTSKFGRPVRLRSVIVNCDILENKLTNVIDNFNNQMRKEKHKIYARIVRKNGLVQLEVHNEHPASK